MDVRAMQDDEVVTVKEDYTPQSAWPAWKHLLEDLADARPPPRLAELLRGPLKNVTILDLSCTSIGSAGTAALAVVLENNTSVRALDLSSNAATDVGVASIAKSLRCNSTLQSLSLHACLIGDKGATELSEALLQNCSLLELNLRQNYIGDTGAQAMARTIAAPSTMLHICDMSNNSYGQAGKIALSQAYASTGGRIETAMPLSWHAGATLGGAARRGGGHGGGHASDEAETETLAKLPQAPRSLVSVESAGDYRLARKSRPPGLGVTTRASSSTPSTPVASTIDARSPKASSTLTRPSIATPSSRTKGKGLGLFNGESAFDDNAKAVAGSGVGWLGIGALKRVHLLRMLLLGTILIATVVLMIQHSTVEDMEDAVVTRTKSKRRKKVNTNSGMLFESSALEGNKKQHKQQALKHLFNVSHTGSLGVPGASRQAHQ